MLLIFTADFIARQLFWYYSVWWFDMPMHFLGGLWVGLFFLWFFSAENMPWGHISTEQVTPKLIFQTIIFVLIIGVLWEWFEFAVNNQIAGEPFKLIDTISDVFFDLAGGALAVFHFFKRIMPQERNRVHPVVEL